MDRRVSLRAALVVGLLAASGCQDYNFNPVGHCLIQPGTKRVTLSKISTADVLFVVDDSNSMLGKQNSLSSAFQSFMTVLNDENASRVASGGVPVDFHIAVTSTSNFLDWTPNGGSTCRAGCGSAAGAVCCLGATNTPQPPQCKVSSECAQGYTCTNACPGTSAVWPVGGGDSACYSNDGRCTPQPISCTTLGAACGLDQRYYNVDSSCTQAYGGAATTMFTPTGEYPMGRFMASPSNEVVLHFTKDLWCPWDPALGKCTTPTPGPGAGALVTKFQQNVVVGTCGSGQEQGLEAARRAIQRISEGRQSSRYVPGEFLHPNSKLVVVWISDENDCSSPNDPASAVTFPPNLTPSNDGCAQDSALPEAQQREYRIADYAAFFTSLQRPVGAAFIVSAKDQYGSNKCQDQSCLPDVCTDPTCTDPNPLVCGGQWKPQRYIALADQLRGRGADVVVGSICDSFGTNLGRIAQIVKPPPGLTLPTEPAAGQVTLLRIVKPDDSTRKTCVGPPLVPMTAAAASAAGFDWWFVEVDDPTHAATGPTKNVYLNPDSTRCQADPGESYSVDYIGQLPPGGCRDAVGCAAALGGSETDWTCLGHVDAVGTTPEQMGSCTCSS
jgi:hypothetical protein